MRALNGSGHQSQGVFSTRAVALDQKQFVMSQSHSTCTDVANKTKQTVNKVYIVVCRIDERTKDATNVVGCDRKLSDICF